MFSGCFKKYHKDPETILLNISTDPVTLNPVLAEDAYSSTIISRMYESLLERDNETLQMKGMLAEKWTVSPNNLVFTFYLRKDVKFHDGQPFTSKDVLFTYQKIMDETTPNPQSKVYFKDVGRVYIPDDYTVIFVMNKPYYKSLEILGGMEIIPEHLFSKEDNFVLNDYNLKNPVGTGPYKFVKWKTRQKVVLIKNENYWGKMPDIKQIEYKIIEDDSVALQSLKKQELDMKNLTPFQWMRQSASEKFERNFKKVKYLSTSYNYIGYNTRKFPFDKKEVREAMTFLVNREKIRTTILNGLSEITTGNFWINSDQYNKNLEPRKYNPQLGVKLLNDAGFTDSDNDGILDLQGKKLSFEIMVPSGVDFYRRVTPVLKEDFSRHGVEVNIREIQFQALIEKINKREFEAMMLAWSIGIEGDPYQLWHSTQVDKGHNFTGFTTPEMDYIIDQARIEFNPLIRNKLYHRFHEILYENQPYTFLFTNYSLVAIQKRFQNVNVYKAGLDLREWRIDLTAN
jgi:peptide/nickel transport system substrate-binding protein